MKEIPKKLQDICENITKARKHVFRLMSVHDLYKFNENKNDKIVRKLY